ncbi:YkgJ family cysteine cluster protein [uncultured Draconibacterium sp.]|uniref:YkgJ family cysteine cluster protein n=1 Tax=uncultured Draconibacterium sp. TaxID=1573823 RepID=UPI0025CBE1A9|nr:YkgJ family cysteine cluster protein [uncultured Draconibacterium sp.]
MQNLYNWNNPALCSTGAAERVRGNKSFIYLAHQMNINYKTPAELKLLADKNRPETLALLKKLKKKKPKRLDDVVHALHYEAFDYFDCLDCANCCKTIGPRLIDKDLDRLAKHLKMKVADFIEQYIRIDEDGDFVFKEHPCPFLLPDNYCMVYESRPKACREYPHTDRKRFYQILDLSHKNCETCPVVLEIFEALKQESF